MGHDDALGLLAPGILPATGPCGAHSETHADPSMSADAVAGLPVHNGKTGELLMMMAGERPCRVSKRKLRKLFSEGLTIQYGKRRYR